MRASFKLEYSNTTTHTYTTHTPHILPYLHTLTHDNNNNNNHG
jgi:hypothetical protein